MEKKFVFNDGSLDDYFNQLSFNISNDCYIFLTSNKNLSKIEIFNEFMNKIYLDPIILNRHNITPMGKIRFSRIQNKNVLFLCFECKILSGNAALIQYAIPGINFPLQLQFEVIENIFSIVFETKETEMSNGAHLPKIYHKEFGDLMTKMFDNVYLLNKEIKKFNIKNSFILSDFLSKRKSSESHIDFRVHRWK